MIEFLNVSKKYKSSQVMALNDFTAKIDKGEFVFVVGKSGAGKSTVLKLLIRETNVDKGKILVNDKDITRFRRRKIAVLRRNFGTVFQDFRLLTNKTVYENVAFAMEVLRASNRQIKKRVPEALELVGLADKMNQKPYQLSGGEQQRVAIARAIVNNPSLLLADEPTGNLDPETSKEIMNLFLNINITGTTVIVATHEKNIVDAMQKRVIHLDKGVLVSDVKQGGYNDDALLD